jgi:1,5-anhydro-D-fructose reductase (1,5-anhydro-D-mannitol-forming)
MSLGWAILGTGRFASSRAAPALAKAIECRAVAVVSRDLARAREYAAEHGIPVGYGDLQAALADPRIEAVWVTSPHSLHLAHVLACARAGRHVLCEKPLATTVADARQMVTACEQAGVRLGTGFHLRHHPLHIEARRLVHEGRLGQVVYASAEWSTSARADADLAPWRADPVMSGGGVFTATGVHALDLLRYVLDDEIESVSAEADAGTAAGEVERALVCRLRFRRGTLATVRCFRSVYAPANDLILEGSTGAIRVRHSLEEQARGSIELEGVSAPLRGVPAGTDLYALEVEAFATAIRERREPNASGLDGLRAVEATAAVYESVASGCTVRLAG